MAAPRQTQSDRWAQRPCVMRYRRYADDLRAAAARLGFSVPPCGMRLTFYLPMPPSWSLAKRARLDGTPHQQKPDLDNLTKAFLDALCPCDAFVWQLAGVEKRWAANAGRIYIEIAEPIT